MAFSSAQIPHPSVHWHTQGGLVEDLEAPPSARNHRRGGTPAVLAAFPVQPDHTGYSSPRTQTSQTLTPGQEWALPSQASEADMGYQAVDPYHLSIAHYVNHRRPKRRKEEYPSLVTSPQSPADGGEREEPTTRAYVKFFITHTIPQQIYLHILLRLPSMYWSRIARIFEEAEMSLPDIAKMITGSVRMKSHASRGTPRSSDRAPITVPQKQYSVFTLSSFEPEAVPDTFLRLINTWEIFIDSMLKEWKILNIVSVLLLSAIVSILQIDAAAADPITRTAALLSLICALMSLLYGCMYSIRFYDMRKPHKAAQWAQEAQRKQSDLFWNVWVFLAMPAVWLAWSIVAYVVCIMAYVWRTGAGDVTSTISQKALIGLRVTVSVILFLGVVYFVFILRTLRRYGDPMDKQWRSRAIKWIEEAREKLTTTQKPEHPRSAERPHPHYPTSVPMHPMHSQAWLSESSRLHGSSSVYDSLRSAQATPWSQGGVPGMIPPGPPLFPQQWPQTWTPGAWGQSPWNTPGFSSSGWTPYNAPMPVSLDPNTSDWARSKPTPSAIYATPNSRPHDLPPGFVPLAFSPSPGRRMAPMHAASSWVPQANNYSHEPTNQPRFPSPLTPFIPPTLSPSNSPRSAILTTSPERVTVDPLPRPLLPTTPYPAPLLLTPEPVFSDLPSVAHDDENGGTTIKESQPGGSQPENANTFETEPLPEPKGFSRLPPDELNTTPFLGVRVMEISPTRSVTLKEVPASIINRDITQEDWSTFITDVDKVFPHNPNVRLSSPRMGKDYPESEQRLFGYLHLWNTNFFLRRKIHVVFCSETNQDLLSPTQFALYLLDSSKSPSSKELIAETHQEDELKRVDPIWPIYGEGPLSWIPSLGPIYSANSPVVRFSAHPTLIARGGTVSSSDLETP